MEDIYGFIIKRIKQARRAAGLTQQEVADRLGITGAGYSYIETGTNKVSIEYLIQLARLFDRPVTWFLGIADDITPQEREVLDMYRQADERTKKLVRIVLS